MQETTTKVLPLITDINITDDLFEKVIGTINKQKEFLLSALVDSLKDIHKKTNKPYLFLPNHLIKIHFDIMRNKSNKYYKKRKTQLALEPTVTIYKGKNKVYSTKSNRLTPALNITIETNTLLNVTDYNCSYEQIYNTLEEQIQKIYEVLCLES